jgi:hypothetical protein
MAFTFSTGLRHALLGAKDTITADTLSTTATDTISDSGNGLLAAGFRPGDTLTTSGWTDAANNGICTVTSVAATGASMVIAGLTLTTEGAGDTVTITANSKGMKDIFANNVIRIYSGAAPATADAVETGVLLLRLTKSSGAVTAGTSTNGNNFDAIASGVLSKDANVWSGVGLADGTAAYYRMYDNGLITGESTTSKRCQGTCGTSGSDFVMSSTSVVTGATVTLDTHNITQPAS